MREVEFLRALNHKDSIAARAGEFLLGLEPTYINARPTLAFLNGRDARGRRL
jgi:hypothetical protein